MKFDIRKPLQIKLFLFNIEIELNLTLYNNNINCANNIYYF